MSLKQALERTIAIAAVLALVTLLCRRLFAVNPTTVALTFLVIVLLTSAFWGFRIAVLAACAATALFNFFFLPPVRTFTISDPQNWIALIAFLITAIVASNLAERARRQTELAQQRRVEVERLYLLSQDLLTSDNTAQLFNEVPKQLVEVFGTRGAALVLSGRDTIYRSSPDLQFDTELLLRANARGEISEANGTTYLPLRIGVRVAGAVAIVGERLSRETLDAISSLIGIAAERNRAIEELAETRAAQENEKLRAALLDSVTHEFRTPLTSIKASVTALLDENTLKPAEHHELLSVIDEETDRLNRLVGEAAEMAQLDAHMVRLERLPHSVGDVISFAMEQARAQLAEHPVTVEIAPELRQVSFDFGRIAEVLTHLVENAAKYSEKSRPIRISVEQQPAEVIISVADQGSGIDATEQGLIFEKFYRGHQHRLMAHGTGMGLAISKVLVEAHGGSLKVVSQPGAGSVFSVHLPIA